MGMNHNDETVETLRARLGEVDIIDLVMVIAFYNGAVRLLGALDLDVELAFQPELDAHPFSIE